MQPTQERKAPPPVEVSMNYMSWSVKDLVKELQKLCSTMNEMAASVKGIEKAILSKDKPPF